MGKNLIIEKDTLILIVSNEVRGKIATHVDRLQVSSSISPVTLAGPLGAGGDQPSNCKARGSSSVTWSSWPFLASPSVSVRHWGVLTAARIQGRKCSRTVFLGIFLRK